MNTIKVSFRKRLIKMKTILPRQSYGAKTVWNISHFRGDLSKHVWFNELGVWDQVSSPSKGPGNEGVFWVLVVFAVDHSK